MSQKIPSSRNVKNRFEPVDKDGYVYLRLTYFSIGKKIEDCYSIKSVDYLKKNINNFTINGKFYIENTSPCNYRGSNLQRVMSINFKNVIGEIKDIEIREFPNREDMAYIYGRVKLYGKKEFKHNQLASYFYPRVIHDNKDYVESIITFDLHDQFHGQYGQIWFKKGDIEIWMDI